MTKKSEKLESLILLILSISERPGMFFINCSDDISHFLRGYAIASDDEIKDFLNGFGTYVNDYCKKNHFLNKEEFEVPWNNWIRFLRSENYGSIELFDKIFREYIKSLD